MKKIVGLQYPSLIFTVTSLLFGKRRRTVLSQALLQTALSEPGEGGRERRRERGRRERGRRERGGRERDRGREGEGGREGERRREGEREGGREGGRERGRKREGGKGGIVQ